MGIRKQTLAVGATAAAALAVAGPAQAGTFICVPATAGAAVTSGGTSGSCATGTTTVELPSSRQDQQTLIKILPYVSFDQYLDGHHPVVGVVDTAAKPTIIFNGANVQVVKTRGASGPDGTGHIVVGQAANATTSTTGGSENIVVGRGHSWGGSGNLIAGEHNVGMGSFNLVAGLATSGNGVDGLALGWDNHVTGTAGVAVGHKADVSADRGEAIGTKQSATTADQSTIGSPNHHWAKFSGANKLVAASEQPVYYAYGSYGYDYVQFKGVDPAKCAITVTAQSVGSAYGNISTGYYLYSTYILAYAKDSANNFAANVPLDVTADCPQGPYAPAN